MKTAWYSGPPKSIAACCCGSPPTRRVPERPGSSLRSRFSSVVASNGQLEPDAGRLAERGVGHARLVATFSLLLQEQVEVEVAPGCHQLRSFACSVRTPD